MVIYLQQIPTLVFVYGKLNVHFGQGMGCLSLRDKDIYTCINKS